MAKIVSDYTTIIYIFDNIIFTPGSTLIVSAKIDFGGIVIRRDKIGGDII
jgi:hypothetical protein